MKRNLLITAAAGLAIALSAPSASAALSASDLVGKKCGVIANGTNIAYPVGQLHKCSDVIAGASSDQIIIKNFLGAFDLPLTVNANGTLSIDLDNTYPCILNGKRYYAQIKKRDLKRRGYPYYHAGYTYVDDTDELFYGECYDLVGGTATSDPVQTGESTFDYGFTFNNEYYNTVTEQDAVNGFIVKFDDKNFEYFGSFDFCFFDTSCKAVQTYTNGTTLTYDVNVALDLENNKFQVDNLFNFGIMYENTIDSSVGFGKTDPVPVVGDLNFNNGTLKIDALPVGGTTVCFPDGTHGTADAKQYVEYYGDLIYYNIYGADGYWEFDYNVQLDHHFLTSGYKILNNEGENEYHFEDFPVTGTFGIQGDPTHKKDMDFWVTDGGNTKTYVPITMTLNNPKYFSLYKGGYIEDATSIKIDGLAEITHQAKLNLSSVDIVSDSHSVGVSGTITERSNNQHVASYDLYVVPGGYKTITDPGFVTHETTGHKNGYYIGNIPVTVSRANGTDLEFNLRKENAGAGLTPYCDPVFYLKANYNNNIIEPTFHSLTQFEGTITAIETIEAEEAEPEAVYYNLQGVQVVNPEGGNIYIVRRGAKATKELYR